MIGRIWRALLELAGDYRESREMYLPDCFLERARRTPEEQRRRESARGGDAGRRCSSAADETSNAATDDGAQE